MDVGDGDGHPAGSPAPSSRPTLSPPSMSSLHQQASMDKDKDSKQSDEHVKLDTADAHEAAHYHGPTVSLDHNVHALLQNPLAGIPRVRVCPLPPPLHRTALSHPLPSRRPSSWPTCATSVPWPG